MARSISNDLKTHLSSAVTTVALCCRITRLDATEFFFTTHDTEITYSGDVYTPEASFNGSAIHTTSDLSTDNMEVEGIINSDYITESDLRTGKFTGAIVELFIVNYANLAQGKMTSLYGTLGIVTINRIDFAVELRSLLHNLQQNAGRRLMKTCDAMLGDSRCSVSLGSYTVTGAVSGVTNRLVFTINSVPAARGGVFTFTSGANNGVEVEVYEVSGSTITLLRPTPYDIAVTDTYSVYRGCDKLLSTCRDTFANVVNFRGFNDLTSMNKILGFS